MKEKTLREMRVDLLKQMDSYVRFHIGNELATKLWLLIFPDEATEEDLLEIADDNELWTDCCVLLGKLVRKYDFLPH